MIRRPSARVVLSSLVAASGVTLDLNGFDLLGVAGSLDGVSVTVAGMRNIAVVNGSVRFWGGDGVDLGGASGTNCRVADLLASDNTGDGIFTGSSSTVSNCSVQSNGAIGILVSSGSTILNCTVTNNISSGISVGNGSTITNWDVVAGNVILVVNATTAALVTGGTAPGSTDPNANFTY